MQARAIVFFQKQVVLRDFELPEPGEGEVLLEAEITCVSPGSELRCLRTEPVAEAYIPGYAFVGRVLRSRAAGVAEGARYFCPGTRSAIGLATNWGGHCSHALTPAAQLTRVPEGVSPLAASLGALGGIAMHGVRPGGEPRGAGAGGRDPRGAGGGWPEPQGGHGPTAARRGSVGGRRHRRRGRDSPGSGTGL